MNEDVETVRELIEAYSQERAHPGTYREAMVALDRLAALLDQGSELRTGHGMERRVGGGLGERTVVRPARI